MRPVKQAAGVDKVNVVIHNDFSAYSEGVLEQLKGAVGCVWALRGAGGSSQCWVSLRHVYGSSVISMAFALHSRS